MTPLGEGNCVKESANSSSELGHNGGGGDGGIEWIGGLDWSVGLGVELEMGLGVGTDDMTGLCSSGGVYLTLENVPLV